ncbi:MAG TPA: alkaline phosphatase family protein [Polyangiaceae bacterium]
MALVFVSCLMVLSCLGRQPEASPRGERQAPPLEAATDPVTVMVVLDGVRWQEIFHGVDRARARRLNLRPETARQLLPNLYRLIDDHGCVLGAPGAGSLVSASGPDFLSLPGYTEIFSGAAPVDCPDNECGRVHQVTIADQVAQLGQSPADVAVISSWPKVALAASHAPEHLLISAGRSEAENAHVLRQYPAVWQAYLAGARAKPAPGWGEFRPDRHTAALALDYLRHAEPRFLFVGLGETDEYAHRNDYRSYLSALRDADRVVGRIYEVLERAARRGATTLLFVTSDHGRAEFAHHGKAYPESARTWLVAAGSAVRARGVVRSPEPRRLADLAPTLRALWGFEGEAPSELLLDRELQPGRVLTELFQ